MKLNGYNWLHFQQRNANKFFQFVHWTKTSTGISCCWPEKCLQRISMSWERERYGRLTFSNFVSRFLSVLKNVAFFVRPKACQFYTHTGVLRYEHSSDGIKRIDISQNILRKMENIRHLKTSSSTIIKGLYAKKCVWLKLFAKNLDWTRANFLSLAKCNQMPSPMYY